MSYIVTAVSKLHERQLTAATKLQGFVVEAARRFAAVSQEAPGLRERVGVPLRKAAVPLARTLGTPAELSALLRKNARDWVELQIEVQAALIEALGPEKPVEQAATLRAV